MPEDYLPSLRLGHASIHEATNAVSPFLRSYREAKPRLREMREQTANFLGRQTQAMFDELYRFYQDDRASTKMIDFLLHDLKDVRVAFLLFFDKHSGEPQDIKASSFPKDFTDFSARLLGRMKIEEQYLFPLLERMRAP